MRFTSPHRGFVLLYALAYCGLFISFMPFITLLLPLKVEAVAPQERVALLSAAALGGAAVASVANIIAGALSDVTHRRRGTRRPWVALGLCGIVLSYAGLHLSWDGQSLLLAVAAIQVSLNLMFAPLTALLADEIPDERKGLVSGLIGIAQPIGTLAAVAMTLRELGGEAARYLILCGTFTLLIAPLLFLARESGSGSEGVAPPALRTRRRIDFALAWLARLLVQVAGNGLVTYSFFYFEHVLAGAALAGELHARRIAITTAAITAVALAMTIGAGHLSDRLGRRKPFLLGAAAIMATGLVLMAAAGNWTSAAIGYGAAMSGLSVFLALQSALTMQLLPSPGHRGRDMGVVNLTNTLPAMVAPLLALVLAPERAGFSAFLIALVVVTLTGGLIVLAIRSED